MKKQAVDLQGKAILVTGSPGFIGSNLVLRLLKELHSGTVISFDSMNDYYDPALKEYRLSLIEKQAESSPARHIFIRGNLADRDAVRRVFETWHPDIVVNLAAQAGVRYSIDHPDAYMESNVIGFYNILEACRHFPVEHLVYASSSSVYGGNRKVPFSVDDMVDHPVSLYAATKKSAELLAHSYAKLYNIPSTGLRFFTVYGPAGRVMQGAPEKKTGEDGLPLPPYALYNIGGGTPVNLMEFVRTLQEELVSAGILPPDYDFAAHQELVGMQPGDVPVTYADSGPLEADYGFRPQIPLREGLRRFAKWYRDYYQ